MIEQIKMLEYHTQLLAHLIDITVLIHDIVAVKEDFAGSGLLQTVEAAQEGTFAGTGRTDDNDTFTLLNMAVDVLQYLKITKVLF